MPRVTKKQITDYASTTLEQNAITLLDSSVLSVWMYDEPVEKVFIWKKEKSDLTHYYTDGDEFDEDEEENLTAVASLLFLAHMMRSDKREIGFAYKTHENGFHCIFSVEEQNGVVMVAITYTKDNAKEEEPIEPEKEEGEL